MWKECYANNGRSGVRTLMPYFSKSVRWKFQAVCMFCNISNSKAILKLWKFNLIAYFLTISGSVPGGLLVHPDSNHLLYPLGNTVVIEDLMATDGDTRQEFLSGHTNNVSCIAVSKSGRYVASGQSTHMGFKADVIVWDFKRRAAYKTFTLHKVKVQALAFSPNDKFLVTLGGEDDGRYIKECR